MREVALLYIIIITVHKVSGGASECPYSITARPHHPPKGARARDLALHSTLSHYFCPWRPHGGQVLTSEWPLGDLRMPTARPPPPPLKVTGTRLLLGRCTPAVRPLPPERESLPLAGSFICSVCFLIRSVFLPGFSVLSLSSPLLFPEFDFSWSCQSDAPGP